MDRKVLEVVLELKDKLAPALKRVATDTRAATTNMSRAVNFLEKNWLAVAAAITAVILVIRQLTISAGAILQLGMDAVESENLFEVSFKGMADAARKWSTTLAEAVGLNEFELRKMAAVLFNMTSNMGLAKDKAFELATGLTELAFDMASFFNLQPDVAFLKIQAAISGEIEPLRRLGIIVDEASTKMQAYKDGLAEVGEELTQAQKVQARYNLILKQTIDAQGDLARTLESPANRVRILATQFELLKTFIAAQFLPQLNILLGMFIDITKALVMDARATAALGEQSVVTAGIVARSIGWMIKAFNLLSLGAHQIGEAFSVAGKQTAQFIVGLGNVLLSFMRSVVQATEKMINSIIGGLNKAITGLNKFPLVAIQAINKVTLSTAGLDTAIGGLLSQFNEIDRQVGEARGNLEKHGIRVNQIFDEIKNAMEGGGTAAAAFDLSVAALTEGLGDLGKVMGDKGGGGGGGGEGGGLIDKIIVLTGLARGFRSAWTPVVELFDIFADTMDKLTQSVTSAIDELDALERVRQMFFEAPPPGFREAQFFGTPGFVEGEPVAPPQITEGEEAGKGFFADFAKAFSRNENLLALGGSAIQGGIAGGGRGAMGAIMPLLGNLIAPGIGGVLGGLLGGIFGKKKPRGQTRSQPQYVHIVNTDDVGTQMLKVVKTLLLGRAGGGIDRIGVQLRMQSARIVI